MAYDSQTGEEPFELIAVDDGSSDTTYEVLTSYHPSRYSLNPVRLEKNQGPAAARNRGISVVTAPLMAFVGDDMLPAPGFIQGHLDAHRAHPEKEVAILGRAEWPQDMPVNTLMKHIDGVGAQQFCYYFMRDGQEYDFRFFYTCNLSLKSDFMRSLRHWFDCDFYLYGFEDIELGYRLKLLGLHLVYSKDIVVYHYHYHNIWTFIRRQRNSGIMANILFAKHPNLMLFLQGLFVPVLRLLKYPRDLFSRFSSEALEQLETLACLMTGQYEWNSHSLLVKLYNNVLEYFYIDGYIRGLRVPRVVRDHFRSANARKNLAPNLHAFLDEAGRTDVPVFGGSIGVLNNRIKELSDV